MNHDETAYYQPGYPQSLFRVFVGSYGNQLNFYGKRRLTKIGHATVFAGRIFKVAVLSCSGSNFSDLYNKKISA